MAFTTVTVSNGKEFKQVPLGFSWTMFFFGPFPAFARKDWGLGVILLFLCVFSFNAIGMIGAFFTTRCMLERFSIRAIVCLLCLKESQLTKLLGI